MIHFKSSIWLLVLLAVSDLSIAQPQAGIPLQQDKLNYAKEVEREALAKKDTLLLAEVYYLYGKINVDAKNYLKAKSYFIQSLQIVEQKHQFDKVSRIYGRLSWLEREQLNMVKQLEYARISLAYARLGTRKSLMSAYQEMSEGYMAVCHDSLARYGTHPLQDSVFYYCKLATKIAYELKDSVSIAGMSGQLGKIYGFQHNPRAFYHYQVALKMHAARNNTFGQIATSQQLAYTYLQFNQPDKAYPLLQKANALYNAMKIRAFKAEMDFNSLYMEYYRQKGKWQKAFEQSLKVRANERDQMTADRNGAVSRLTIAYEAKYEAKKKKILIEAKERELLLSKQKLQVQNWSLLILLALLSVTVGTSIVLYRTSKKNERLSQQNETLVQEQNHRVKNNLQLISSLLRLQVNGLDDDSARNAVEDSQRRIEVMSLLQRKLYDGEDVVNVNVADFVAELVDLVLRAFNQEQVEVAYHIEPNVKLPVDHMMRIGLIINELITNACKYAFPDNPKPALQISAQIVQKTFHLGFTDNGPGFTRTNPPVRSFGLRLIQMQVEQLFGTYRMETKGYFQFDMKFNLIQSFQFRGKPV
ncbi:sensor histidine kinase [Salmonirosea aquatica]